MKLIRNEVANKYYGKHISLNYENKENIINYLDEMNKYLDSFEYESDSDFIFCGRKKFVYEEIIEIINGKGHLDNPVYFVLGSLEELITDNNSIPMSDSQRLGMDWNDLRDANDRYIKKGFICLEEIQYIKKIIVMIENYVENNM